MAKVIGLVVEEVKKGKSAPLPIEEEEEKAEEEKPTPKAGRPKKKA